LELEELIKKTNDAGHQERPTAPNEDTKATALARVERLTAAHAEAVAEIERIRKQLGQLTTASFGTIKLEWSFTPSVRPLSFIGRG
jgi:hypothetical protein